MALPRRPQHPYIPCEPYAHRVFHQDVPENTLEAIQAAANLGVRWMEIDVRTTADGVVIVFHDEDLKRVAGKRGRIAEKTWAEVQKIELPGGIKIPSLKQTLAQFPELYFNIDVKDTGSVAALPAVIARASAEKRVRVASFSEKRRTPTVRAINKLVSGTRVRASFSELYTFVFWACAHWAPSAWHPVVRVLGLLWEPFDALQVPQTYRVLGREVTVVTRKFVDFAHRHNKTVQVWTIDEAQQMRELIRLGVDGIVTNRSDVLVKVLADVERGRDEESGD